MEPLNSKEITSDQLPRMGTAARDMALLYVDHCVSVAVSHRWIGWETASLIVIRREYQDTDRVSVSRMNSVVDLLENPSLKRTWHQSSTKISLLWSQKKVSDAPFSTKVSSAHSPSQTFAWKSSSVHLYPQHSPMRAVIHAHVERPKVPGILHPRSTSMLHRRSTSDPCLPTRAGMSWDILDPRHAPLPFRLTVLLGGRGEGAHDFYSLSPAKGRPRKTTQRSIHTARHASASSGSCSEIFVLRDLPWHTKPSADGRSIEVGLRGSRRAHMMAFVGPISLEGGQKGVP
nr:hypothetical protein CFP56_11149 [Quercus suber]